MKHTINTPEQTKVIKQKMAMYRRCSQGKHVNCDKCIGCASRK